MLGEDLRHAKCAFQGLKRTFMHVSGLPPTYFDKKPITFQIVFFNQNMVGEDVGHAKTRVSGPETQVYACLRSSPNIF